MHRPVWKRGAAWGRQSGLHTLNSGGAAWAEALLGAAVPALLPLRFVLPAGAQGPGGSAESHLLWDHLHAGERSSPLGQERHRAPPRGGAALPSLAPLPSPQNPAVVDAPLRLVLQVSAPPRCVIKPSGTSISVSAFLNISLVPADRPAVQLSSMAMVSAAAARLPVPAQVHRAGAPCTPPGKSLMSQSWEQHPGRPAACPRWLQQGFHAAHSPHRNQS